MTSPADPTKDEPAPPMTAPPPLPGMETADDWLISWY